MIAAVVVLSAAVAALTAGLILSERHHRSVLDDVLEGERRERAALIDVIVSRNPQDLTRLRQASAPPSEVRDFVAERDRELRAMGYAPEDVPPVPSGF